MKSQQAIIATLISVLLIGCSYTPPSLSEQLRIAERKLELAQMIHAGQKLENAECFPFCTHRQMYLLVEFGLDVDAYVSEIESLKESFSK